MTNSQFTRSSTFVSNCATIVHLILLCGSMMKSHLQIASELIVTIWQAIPWNKTPKFLGSLALVVFLFLWYPFLLDTFDIQPNDWNGWAGAGYVLVIIVQVALAVFGAIVHVEWKEQKDE